MLTVGQEHRDPMEIDVGGKLYAVTFSADGEYIFSGSDNGVQVWRVEDGKQMAIMEVNESSVQRREMDRSGDIPGRACMGCNDVQTSLCAPGRS